MEIKYVSIRISEEILNKLRRVAREECRSVNAQIYMIIRDYIEQYEKQHGSIKE